MKTTVKMNGNDYEVTLPELFQSGEPKVFVIIRRNPVSAAGNYVQDTVYRTIKPYSQNWTRAVRLAKEALLIGSIRKV